MTKEEARNVFGCSIVNNLLSLGAEPTNVVRQDGWGNRRMSFGCQLYRGKYVFSQARCQRYFV
mgnify:FL=1